VNLTGVGVAVTSAILEVADGNLILIALIMAVVCLIAGMGLPTSAAYVLVAAVFAPVLIQQGLEPITVHLFVLYYAVLSVITPPVCIAVFVAATIAKTSWTGVASQSLRLGVTAYAIPMLMLIYPGLLLQGGAIDITMAILAGVGFTLSIAAFFAGQRVFGRFTFLLWAVPATFLLFPYWPATLTGVSLVIVFWMSSKRYGGTAYVSALESEA
jgi:TRAP-type uncharacterized transport system fused permease subunit